MAPEHARKSQPGAVPLPCGPAFARPLLTVLVAVAAASCSTTEIGPASARDPEFGLQEIATAPIDGQVDVDLRHYADVQRRPGQDPGKAVGLVLSGGGHRAVNYCAGVMMALEEFSAGGRHTDYLAECDYLITHSGGGFAAAAYLVTLDRFVSGRGGADRAGYSFATEIAAPHRGGKSLKQALDADYFASIGKGLLRDLLPGGGGRGEQFSAALDEKLLHGFRFDHVFVARSSERRPRLPYWLPYSVVNENGSIFMHAPDVYRRYGITAYPHGRSMRAVGGDYGSIPWSLALRASTSVPFLVPPCALESSIHPDLPYVHLVDGAMADNVGAFPGLGVVRQDRARRKVLIVVDANVRQENPFARRRSAGGFAERVYDSVCNAMDANLHRYRENIVVRDIRRDGGGRILRGTTADGVRVVFLYPELLSAEAAGGFGEIGPTLRLERGQQDFLISAGRQLVEIQRESIAWGIGP